MIKSLGQSFYLQLDFSVSGIVLNFVMVSRGFTLWIRIMNIKKKRDFFNINFGLCCFNKNMLEYSN
jgi:hypothetical protein